MPEIHTIDIIMIIAAYLAGSISSAIIFARIMGLPDPRGQGSGNPGATNMLRIGGKKAAILTLAGDMLKGVIPVVIARMIVQPELLILVGFAAFLGHLYPVFFSFQGGKGVATAIGILIATDWMIALFTISVWLIMSALTKISSLSALTAFFLMPVFAALWGNHEPLMVSTLSVLALMLIWRHRSNIRNLMHGTEK